MTIQRLASSFVSSKLIGACISIAFSLAILSGCGDDDDSSTPAGASGSGGQGGSNTGATGGSSGSNGGSSTGGSSGSNPGGSGGSSGSSATGGSSGSGGSGATGGSLGGSGGTAGSGAVAGSGGIGGSGGSAGSGQATFTQVKAVVFGSCAGSGAPGPMTCHGSAPYQGNLDLFSDGAFTNLVGVPADIDGTLIRVIPGDPENSFLYRKLINDLPQDLSLGDPMPMGEAIMWSELPSDQIQLLYDWIAAGAENN